MRLKRADILDPGDEFLAGPGAVVTVTGTCSRTVPGLIILTDRGDLMVPWDAEVRVVAEGG